MNQTILHNLEVRRKAEQIEFRGQIIAITNKVITIFMESKENISFNQALSELNPNIDTSLIYKIIDYWKYFDLHINIKPVDYKHKLEILSRILEWLGTESRDQFMDLNS